MNQDDGGDTAMEPCAGTPAEQARDQARSVQAPGWRGTRRWLGILRVHADCNRWVFAAAARATPITAVNMAAFPGTGRWAAIGLVI